MIFDFIVRNINNKENSNDVLFFKFDLYMKLYIVNKIINVKIVFLFSRLNVFIVEYLRWFVN